VEGEIPSCKSVGWMSQGSRFPRAFEVDQKDCWLDGRGTLGLTFAKNHSYEGFVLRHFPTPNAWGQQNDDSLF
jgi:hypothetical protein